ncbi:phage-related protein (TIGR01555 family) [Kaistia dalseonensis]|uniref:Phage-related protein (TIGR01555 family) n=2 Tax=Kaistia dalseonensis TaxID=410840 RepID=A0ABU0H6P4_9HYPH|nr:phage-related protein (TIGR01555 family) [Kaistia dalseonensis]
MTRAGIDIVSDGAPDDLGKVNEAFVDLGIWERLSETIKWSRLYGGALAVLLIDGQDVGTPLRFDTIKRGQFKGLLVLDRWMVTPELAEEVKELGPDLGRPAFYTVTANAPAYRGKKIHYSRVIRLDGVELPYWQRISENGWGISVLERLYDRMVAFDSTSTGVAQLVYKAHLRTVSVDGLREILAAGGAPEAALIKQFEMIRLMQSNEGLTLIDAKDTFEAHNYTFSGLSDVLLQFAQQLSGALQIPLVRLFGQSPAGLNATGESDIRNYYDGIAAQQKSKLRGGVSKILDLAWRSSIGGNPPSSYSFVFNSLWLMSDTEKATIAVGVTGAVAQAYEAGIVDRETAMRELRQSADVTGVWTNITDEEIQAADDDPPEPSEGGDVRELPDLAAIVADLGADGGSGRGEISLDPGSEG